MQDPDANGDRAERAEPLGKREPIIERSGEEYLVTMPDGTIGVALSHAEAIAMVRLRAARRRRNSGS